MYVKFDSLTSAEDLWYFRHPAAQLERNGDTLCMNRNGVVYSCTVTRQGDVYVRRDSICNTTAAPVTVDPISAKFMYMGGEYQVYTQYNCAQNESNGSWQDLVTQVEASCGSERTTADATPFMVLWSKQANRGTAFHVLPNGTWHLTASRYFIGSNVHRVQVTVGFQDRPALTLAPGETLDLPTVLFYSVRNRVDMDAWKLHRWFHTYHPRREMPFLYNTWLYRFDHCTPEQVESQIPVAAQLGLEYFVMDAGWFGERFKWSNSVGDWSEKPTSSMRGQLKQIADKVREAGMKFGLWLEVERASLTSKIAAEHPEYFVQGIFRGGHGCYMLNFARRDAREYLYTTIEALVKKYGVEFIKFDCNRDLYYIENDPALLCYFEGFRQFMQELSKRLPNVYFSCCASGGMRMDIPNAIRFDSFWISDNQSPQHTMRIFKDTLLRLPPQVIERWATFICAPGFEPVESAPYHEVKLLAAHDGDWHNVISLQPSWLENMLIGSPAGFTCDISTFAPELVAELRENIRQAKKDREFWMRAECRILCDTPSALVLQYNDPSFDRIEISVFFHERQQQFVPVFPVVDLRANYAVDGQTYTGKQLDEDGIRVAFANGWHAKRLSFRKVP